MEKRVYSGSQSKAVVHRGRDAMATGACSIVHIASMVRKQRETNAGAHLNFPVALSGTPAHRMVAPTFRVSSPTSINSSKLSFIDTLRGLFPW